MGSTALGNLHMFTDLDLATPIRQYVGNTLIIIS